MFRPCLFCSENLPEGIKSRLSESYRVISLPAYESFDTPVASHPDMLLFKYRKSLVVHKPYFEKHSSLFEGIGLDILLSEESICSKYPGDVLLNAFYMGDTLFARINSISRLISGRFEKRVNIKQGYAACSVCKVSESALITADTGIAKAEKERGISVLLITPGHIRLEGYDHGFIGGASFVTDNEVMFFGNIGTHPDHEKIISFIEQQGKRCLSLSEDMLSDYGGALIV